MWHNWNINPYKEYKWHNIGLGVCDSGKKGTHHDKWALQQNTCNFALAYALNYEQGGGWGGEEGRESTVGS